MERNLLQQVGKWIVVNISGFLLIALMLIVSSSYVGEDTHDNILTSLSIRVPLIIMGISLLLGGIMAFEWVSPENYLSRISENPIACSIIMSVYVLSVALVISYV